MRWMPAVEPVPASTCTSRPSFLKWPRARPSHMKEVCPSKRQSRVILILVCAAAGRLSERSSTARASLMGLQAPLVGGGGITVAAPEHLVGVLRRGARRELRRLVGAGAGRHALDARVGARAV